MPKVSKVWDGSDPGATPGRVFTASIGQEEIIADGAYLEKLALGLKGAVSSTAVAIETFAGVLSEYTVRVGSDTRIQLSMAELVQLMRYYYNDLPWLWENTDNTGNDFLGGVLVPIHQAADRAKPFYHAATYATQSNIATETLGVSAYWLDAAPAGKKPISAVRVPFTSAGSAGYDEQMAQIPPIGMLRALIVLQTGEFADGNIDVTVQRLRLKLDGAVHSQFNALSDGVKNIGTTNGILDPLADLCNVYEIFEFPGDGVDLKGHEAKVAIDVQDTSDAVVVVPVIELA